MSNFKSMGEAVVVAKARDNHPSRTPFTTKIEVDTLKSIDALAKLMCVTRNTVITMILYRFTGNALLEFCKGIEAIGIPHPLSEEFERQAKEWKLLADSSELNKTIDKLLEPVRAEIQDK